MWLIKIDIRVDFNGYPSLNRSSNSPFLFFTVVEEETQESSI